MSKKSNEKREEEEKERKRREKSTRLEDINDGKIISEKSLIKEKKEREE